MIEHTRLPKIDCDNLIDIESINDLSYKDMYNWIKLVLFSNINYYEITRDIMPHSFLINIFHKINIKTRILFQDVLLAHLSDFCNLQEISWISDCGDELLLLIGDVFNNSDREKEPVDMLLSMLGIDPIKSSAHKLHWRILQTIITLNYSPDLSFWIKQYEENGKDYAPIVVAGISLFSTDYLFDWLKCKDDINIYKAFINRLPLLIENEGTDYIKNKINDLIPFLKYDNYNEIVDNVKYLNLQIDEKYESSLFKDWSDSQINDFAKQLNIDLPEERMFKIVLNELVETSLRDKSKNFAFIDEVPVEIRSLIGICMIITKEKISLLTEYIEKISYYIDYVKHHKNILISDFINSYIFYTLKFNGIKPLTNIKTLQTQPVKDM